jgi:hypothetical protein
MLAIKKTLDLACDKSAKHATLMKRTDMRYQTAPVGLIGIDPGGYKIYKKYVSKSKITPNSTHQTKNITEKNSASNEKSCNDLVTNSLPLDFPVNLYIKNIGIHSIVACIKASGDHKKVASQRACIKAAPVLENRHLATHNTTANRMITPGINLGPTTDGVNVIGNIIAG